MSLANFMPKSIKLCIKLKTMGRAKFRLFFNNSHFCYLLLQLFKLIAQMMNLSDIFSDIYPGINCKNQG